MLLLNALPLTNATNLLFPPRSSRLMLAKMTIYNVLTISEDPSKEGLKVTLRYFAGCYKFRPKISKYSSQMLKSQNVVVSGNKTAHSRIPGRPVHLLTRVWQAALLWPHHVLVQDNKAPGCTIDAAIHASDFQLLTRWMTISLILSNKPFFSLSLSSLIQRSWFCFLFSRCHSLFLLPRSKERVAD